MATQIELKIKKTIAHRNAANLTPEEVEAITPELLNSKIGDGSRKSERSVAFCLAATLEGRRILAANNYALALQIEPETLNDVIEQGHSAGFSVAYLLAEAHDGREILAANNHALALQIEPQTLNIVAKYGKHAGFSVAFFLASNQVSILAANDCFLGAKINKIALNALIKNKPWRLCESVAFHLAYTVQGRIILAAKGNALALLITPETLNLKIPYNDMIHYMGKSVFSILNYGSQTDRPSNVDSDICVALLKAIQERHRNNEVMLTLFSAQQIPRLKTRSSLSLLKKELIGSVLEYMDGRSYKSPRPQI